MRASPSPDLAEPGSVELGAARVLVVDDDDAVRNTLADILEAEGLDVVGLAADGVEAIAKAEALHPDAVILDVRMPRVGGIEAAGRIHQLAPDIRLIMLSAYEDPTLQQEAFAAGASSFLVKGCPLSELLAATRS